MHSTTEKGKELEKGVLSLSLNIQFERSERENDRMTRDAVGSAGDVKKIRVTHSTKAGARGAVSKRVLCVVGCK